MLKIPIQKSEPNDRPLPKYQTAGAAGMDLHAALPRALEILPGERKLIPTGIRMAIPAGFEGQIRPRSSLALRYGVTVVNSPGTIDSDFRGELGIVLINHGQAAFVVEPEERVAQIVFQRVERAVWQAVELLDESARGEGGYGSTGR